MSKATDEEKALQLGRALLKQVKQRGGTEKDVARLFSRLDLLGADAAHLALTLTQEESEEKYRQELIALSGPEEFYDVDNVVYGEFPSEAELKKTFETVSAICKGQQFYLVEEREKDKRVPGKRRFLLKGFTTYMPHQKAIDWGLMRGYLPAIRVEALAFATAVPDAQMRNRILSVGEWVPGGRGSDACFLVLASNEGRRCIFGAGWDDGAWGPKNRFLYIEKIKGTKK